VQTALHTAGGHLDEVGVVDLYRDGLQARRVEELLLRHARNPVVGPGRRPVRVLLFHDSDNLVQLRKAAQRVHLSRGVLMPDPDLSYLDAAHRT